MTLVLIEEKAMHLSLSPFTVGARAVALLPKSKELMCVSRSHFDHRLLLTAVLGQTC